MPNRNRFRRTAALMPAGALAAILALAIPAAQSSAASGSTVYSANLSLTCVLDPGSTGLNVAGTVTATLAGTGPTEVNPGDSVSLTNVTTSLTTPANWSTSLAAFATQAVGSVTNF